MITGLLLISSLCTQCGPAVSPATTQAIIKVESGGKPYVINDNTTRKSFSPTSKTEAIHIASELLSQGHSLDLGIMQINSTHLQKMNLTLDELFDPCRNINIGTNLLAEAYRRNNNGESGSTVLFKALSAYNTGSAWRGPDYINRILKAAGATYRVAVINPPPEKRRSIATAVRKSKAGTASVRAENHSLFFPASNLSQNVQGL
ncbi:MAG: lytic transglycosylase domain-containing protein [Desulfuromonadales bacterium]|nr:lytic transglycosylase domain-containing protein [Desulfuromonadales bacterium]